MNEVIKSEGNITITIKERNGNEEILKFKNKVLRSGRVALAAALAGSFGSSFDSYIDGITWGGGGVSGGAPRFVPETQAGLFGVTIASKGVITSVDPNNETVLNITSILDYDEANGTPINEVALIMKSEDFFSMATFSDITKTSSVQWTINWSLSFV